MQAQQTQASGLADQLRAAGLDVSTFNEASLGTPGAMRDLGDAVDAAIGSLTAAGGPLAGFGDTLTGAGVSAEQFAAAVRSGDWTGVTSQVNAYAESVGRATGNSSDASAILENWRNGLDAAGPALTALGGAQDIAAESAAALAEQQGKAVAEFDAIHGQGAAAAGPNPTAPPPHPKNPPPRGRRRALARRGRRRLR